MKIRTISENIEFIRKHPVKIVIETRHLLGACSHNLICWICGKEKAVYSMYPKWVFKPCWECQREIHGNPKKWYEFWR